MCRAIARTHIPRSTNLATSILRFVRQSSTLSCSSDSGGDLSCSSVTHTIGSGPAVRPDK
jgi:hypothetical protein